MHVLNCFTHLLMFSFSVPSLAHSELSSVFYEKVLMMAWGYVKFINLCYVFLLVTHDVIGSEVVGDALSEYDRFIIRKKGLEVLMLNQSWTTI